MKRAMMRARAASPPRIAVILCELQPGVRASLERLGVLQQVRTVEKYEDALTLARAEV